MPVQVNISNGSTVNLVLTTRPVESVIPEFEWTTFTPSGSTKFICVDPTLGNDANIAYDTQGAAEASPVETLVRAYALARDGFPDWILLKRGETFLIGDDVDKLGAAAAANNPFHKSGADADNYMLIGSYGVGDRPIIEADGSCSPILLDNAALSAYVAFIDLDCTIPTRDPNDVSFDGVDGQTGAVVTAHHILIENCRFDWFPSAVAVQGDSGGSVHHVRIRGCVLSRSYAINGSHTQGLYTLYVDNFECENCWIIHNGWLAVADRPTDVANVGVDATASAFTRASGSFIDDGWKVGFTVLATGFDNDGADTAPTAFTATNVTEASGTYVDVALNDDDFHVLEPVTGTLDCYYTLDTTVMGTPRFVRTFWNITGTGEVSIYAWDWADAVWRVLHAPSETLTVLPGMQGRDTDFFGFGGTAVAADLIGTGGDAGKVRIRYSSAALTGQFSLDQVILRNQGNNGDVFPVTAVSATELEVSHPNNVFVDETAHAETLVETNGKATIRDRNAYISGTEDPLFRLVSNIDSSSEGYQMRLGGRMEGCTSIRNSAAITFGHPESAVDSLTTGTISYCVAIDGRDIENSPRGDGFGVGPANRPFDDVEVFECIAANNESGTGFCSAFFYGGPGTTTGLSMHDNIAYKWHDSGGGGAGFNALEDTTGSGNVIFDNEVTTAVGGDCFGAIAWEDAGITSVTWSNNVWAIFREDAQFRSVTEEGLMTYAEWVIFSGETGSSETPPSYPAADDATIAAYMESIGESPYTVENYSDKCRAQERDNYDERFTARALVDYVRACFGRSAI